MKFKFTILMVALFATLISACSPGTDEGVAGSATTSENAITTDSGLQVEILEEGEGEQAKAGDTVSVHYAGTLLDGTPFDNSYDRGQPFTFVLGQGQVIKGWDEGIAMLTVGSKARLTIPSELGYGERGAGTNIPPNATLVFEVELVDIVHSGSDTPQEAVVLPTEVEVGENSVTTDSGLQIEILEEGEGAQAQAGDIVSVHYVGTLTDGTEFDSSYGRGEPITFPLGQGAVIAGWDEGIAMLNVGGKARMVIPSEIGYGERGAGNVIPPNATLIFEVELVDILPGPPEAPQVVAEDEFTTTDSGLQYYDIAVGSGDTPEAGQTVVVHYTGWLEDGSMFDSSLSRGKAFQFPLGQGAVIPGWDEGLSTMQVGGQRQLRIPADLAYGEAGFSGVIPPNATLIFEVELVAIQ